ncbi:transposase family protein [Streptomyces sp. NPDC047072]|uniref:transposase family protein n=1 Tax=Streptomyces sp. NPDC047072 TaxID=3154809 RepID=UPI0034013651
MTQEVPCLPFRPPRPLPFWRKWPPSAARHRPPASPPPARTRPGWYPLVGLLLICACAVVCGARTITEITEWGQRATTTVLEHLGIRRHLPGRRRAPSHATCTRLLAALDGDALDAAIGACLAGPNHTDTGTCCPPSAATTRSDRHRRARCRLQPRTPYYD